VVSTRRRSIVAALGDDVSDALLRSWGNQTTIAACSRYAEFFLARASKALLQPAQRWADWGLYPDPILNQLFLCLPKATVGLTCWEIFARRLARLAKAGGLGAVGRLDVGVGAWTWTWTCAVLY
jgi:hypothetical protein